MALIKSFNLNFSRHPYTKALLSSLGLVVTNDTTLDQTLEIDYQVESANYTKRFQLIPRTLNNTSSLRSFNTFSATLPSAYELVSNLDLLSFYSKQILNIFDYFSSSDSIIASTRIPKLAFRVDSDGFKLSAVQSSLRLSEKAGFPFTWFVDVKPAIDNLSFYKYAASCKQDIQLHCFNHLFQPNSNKFKRDVLLGKDLLEDTLGYRIKGYSGPSGRYTLNNYRILSELGFTYTSDFSFAHDFPIFNIPAISLLQVPIYPFSIGTSIAANWSTSNYVKHMKSYLKLKYLQRQDAIIYAHPENRIELYTNELLEVFGFARSIGFKFHTFNELIISKKENHYSTFQCKDIISKLEYMLNTNRLGSYSTEQNLPLSIKSIIYKSKTTNFPLRCFLKSIFFKLKQLKSSILRQLN